MTDPSDTPGGETADTPEQASTEPDDLGAEYVADEGEEVLERYTSRPVLRGESGIESAQIWMAAILAAVAGLIVYSNAFVLPLIGADQTLFLDDPAIQSPGSAGDAFHTYGTGALTVLTWSLNAWMAPGNSVLPHLTNVLIHLLNGVFVYLLARYLAARNQAEPVALLAGLAFLVLPGLTGVVNFAAARGELLATAFTLLAVLLYFRATEKEDGPSPRSYVWSLGAFVLAVASAPLGFAVPVLLLLSDAAVRGVGGIHWRLHAGYWVLWVPMLATGVAGSGEDGLLTGLAGRLFEGLAMTGPALVMAFVPDAAYTAAPWAAPAGLVGVACLVAGIVLIGLRVRLGLPLAWLAVAAAGAWLVPSAFDMPVRTAYLAAAGAVLVLPGVFALGVGPAAFRVGAGLAAVALLVYGAISTFTANRVYADTGMYWSHVLEFAPESPEAHYELGQIRLAEGVELVQSIQNLAGGGGQTAEERSQEASALLEAADSHFSAFLDAASESDNRITEAWLGRGEAALFRGDGNAAEQHYQQALAVSPSHQEAALRLAALYEGQSRRLDGGRRHLLTALDYFRYAGSLGPLPGPVQIQFGLSLAAAGFYGEAAQVLEPLSREGGGEQLRQQVAQFREMAQTIQQLQAQAQESLQADPHDAEGLRQYAQSLMMSGEYLRGSYWLEEQLEANPGISDLWIYLGFSRARMGAEETFLEEHPVAARAMTESGNPWLQLGYLCASNGEWEAAETYLRSDAARRGGIELPSLHLAEMALSQQRLDRAAVMLDEALEAAPENGMVHLRLADVALMQGDTARAGERLDEAEALGAPADEISQRRQQLSGAPSQTMRPMIR